MKRADRPAASNEATQRRMRTQKRRETRPELGLRHELWARGLRYRVDAQLPLAAHRRRADLLFRGARVAVFVDGCYWHACPVHGTMPKSNKEWWNNKLRMNVQRDRDTDTKLAELGWRSVRIWEHEDPMKAADYVEAIVWERTRRAAPKGSTRGPAGG